MLNRVTKNPKMSSQGLQQSLATVDVKVHAPTIRNRLHVQLSWEVCQEKNLGKKKMKARLKFAK